MKMIYVYTKTYTYTQMYIHIYTCIGQHEKIDPTDLSVVHEEGKDNGSDEGEEENTFHMHIAPTSPDVQNVLKDETSQSQDGGQSEQTGNNII
jgi:hypothetical protein